MSKKRGHHADGPVFLDGCRLLYEIAGTAFGPLALLALGEILDLAILEKGLHFDLAAACAIKTLSSARCTRVLGYLCHG